MEKYYTGGRVVGVGADDRRSGEAASGAVFRGG